MNTYLNECEVRVLNRIQELSQIMGPDFAWKREVSNVTNTIWANVVRRAEADGLKVMRDIVFPGAPKHD